jgi:hypothetical protein
MLAHVPLQKGCYQEKEIVMKKHSRKSVIATAALVLGLGGVLPADAATIGGFLGEDEGNADVYGLTCPVETRTVRARVNEADVAGIQFSVVVLNPLGRAATASAVDNGLSEFAILEGRAGNYLVVVHKDEEGGEGYNVTLDCHDADGVALDIDAVRVQNQ